jgi:hypothetical protein
MFRQARVYIGFHWKLLNRIHFFSEAGTLYYSDSYPISISGNRKNEERGEGFLEIRAIKSLLNSVYHALISLICMNIYC